MNEQKQTETDTTRLASGTLVLPSKQTELPLVTQSALRVIKPKIDLNRCQKNYRCFVFCPRDAIEIKPNGFPSINYDKCDGCLICLRECPAIAINEEREK